MRLHKHKLVLQVFLYENTMHMLDSVMCNDSLDIHLLHRQLPGPHDVGGQHSAGPALPRPAVDRCHAPPASHLLCRGVSVPGANVMFA